MEGLDFISSVWYKYTFESDLMVSIRLLGSLERLDWSFTVVNISLSKRIGDRIDIHAGGKTGNDTDAAQTPFFWGEAGSV